MKEPPRNQVTSQQILVVDDTPASLKLLTDILTGKGYKVRPAPSGRLALRSAEAEVPDMILLDVLMPDLDGYEVCRRLKSNERTRGVPVIFISSLEQPADKVRGFEIGAVDFISKPIEAEEMLARVETHLSLRRLEKELITTNHYLEERVAARTAELSDANALLEEEISERKRVQEELVRRNEELDAAVEELTTNEEELKANFIELSKTTAALHESEMMYRSLVTAMAEGVIFQAADGRITAVNPAAEWIEGRTAEQMIGHTLYDPQWGAVYEDETPFPEEFHPSMVTLRTGEPQYNVIMGIHRPDGTLVWLSINSQPLIPPGESKPNAVVTTFHDITEEKQAEEALVTSEEKYRTLVESIHVGVFQYKLDQKGTFIWANQAMVTLFGYASLNDFLQISVVDLYKYPEQRKKFLEKLMSNGFVRDYPIQMKKKDGTQIWISVTSHIRYGADGTIQWVEGILEDITADYLIEELKWRAYSQIEKNMEQFVILNDQIRNPLSVILTYVSDSDIPGRDIIEQQVKRIDSLIDQLDKGYLESEKVRIFLRKHQPEIF